MCVWERERGGGGGGGGGGEGGCLARLMINCLSCLDEVGLF